MPIYDYRCLACGKEFEIVETLAEHDGHAVTCPKCGKQKVERVWSRVTAVTSKKS